MRRIMYAQIDPNGLCNSKCWFCPVAYAPNPKVGRENMPIELYEDAVRQLYEGLGNFVDFEMQWIFPIHYNESLLYPHFEEMLQIIKKYGFKTSIATNGVNLTHAKTDIIKKYQDTVLSVVLNVPSADAKRWSELTGMNEKLHAKLLDNIDYASKELLEISKTRSLMLQVNNITQEHMMRSKLMSKAPVVDLNPETGDVSKEVEAFRKLFPTVNVNAYVDLIDRAGWLKTADVLDNSGWIEDLKQDGRKVVGCNSMGDRSQEWIHISASGDVFLCCQDYDFSTVFGNIKENSLEEIWNSKKRKKMIKKSYKDFCTNCVYAVWE